MAPLRAATIPGINMRRFRFNQAFAPALILLLCSCVTPHPGSNAEALRDPWEKTNRKIYAANKKLDKYVALPVTKAYRAVTPTAARHGISNALSNIGEPLSFANAVAQGKIKQAFRTLDRFLINSVIGVGGLADRATDLGRPEEPEDFGQTLAWWGVKSGPFVMLPLIGPSTIRDTAGFGVDIATNPFDYGRRAVIPFTIYATVGKFFGQTIDLRSRLLDSGAEGLLANSLDEYATVRSAYLQRRQSLIYDGNPPDPDDAPVGDAPLAPGATPVGAAGGSADLPAGTNAPVPASQTPTLPAAADPVPKP